MKRSLCFPQIQGKIAGTLVCTHARTERARTHAQRERGREREREERERERERGRGREREREREGGRERERERELLEFSQLFYCMTQRSEKEQR